jgi:para-aminobenzoate synthetase component I
MLYKFSIPLPYPEDWLFRLISWIDIKYPHFVYFQNHRIEYPYGGFPHVIYAGKRTIVLEEVETFKENKELVGLVSFDYKNKIEKLASQNEVSIDLTDSVFLIPELKIEFGMDSILIVSADYKFSKEEIFASPFGFTSNPVVQILPLTSREKYISDIQAIQEHIRSGDIYELNYCMAFVFQEELWNPIIGYLDLMKVSPMPFSALFKSNNKYLISASPERFLKKMGEKIIAQPIKGTIRRGKDVLEDSLLKEILLNSEKERAENLMIVDLMRNDLSRISKTGSVQVEELFGVYTFARVHQMISTVSAVLDEHVKFRDILHATFPMGSMTGAPKIKCLELIEEYENFKRTWFSGSLGILLPNGDFDFNVIIRSILFEKNSGKGFFGVGSAITFDADPEYEYEECLLKVSAIREILSKKK